MAPPEGRGRPLGRDWENHTHLHVHFDPRFMALLEGIFQREGTILATIEEVQAAVAAEGTVVDSVVTLLGGISQQLADAIAQNDPVALQAVVDSINAQSQTLADAVVANTPASP